MYLGTTFEVDQKVAFKSQLIKDFIQVAGTDAEVHLPSVETKIFELVIEYCRHYRDFIPKEIEKPLKSSVLSEAIPNWDSNFIELELETLAELTVAAEYLIIESLLHLACAKLASMVKGKSIKEVNKELKLEMEYRYVDKGRPKVKNKWAEIDKINK